MSTVNLTTKDVLIANNRDVISLIGKGIIKRELIVGASKMITIPGVPENLAKRINNTAPVTIDDIFVKLGDSKTISDIYANVTVIPVEEKAEEVKEPMVEQVVVEEPTSTVEEVVDTQELLVEEEIAVEEEHPTEEVISEDDEETLDGEEEEEVVEENNFNNNNQNNQFNYKKKRRR